LSTVDDKESFSMFLWAPAREGTTIIWQPHYAIEALQTPLTDRLTLKQFFALNSKDINWTPSIAFVNFKVRIGNTDILNETINEGDTNRDDIHIYNIGTPTVPVIAEKEALFSIVITTDPALNPDQVRFIWGLRGTWLRDQI